MTKRLLAALCLPASLLAQNPAISSLPLRLDSLAVYTPQQCIQRTHLCYDEARALVRKDMHTTTEGYARESLHYDAARNEQTVVHATSGTGEDYQPQRKIVDRWDSQQRPIAHQRYDFDGLEWTLVEDTQTAYAEGGVQKSTVAYVYGKWVRRQDLHTNALGLMVYEYDSYTCVLREGTYDAASRLYTIRRYYARGEEKELEQVYFNRLNAELQPLEEVHCVSSDRYNPEAPLRYLSRTEYLYDAAHRKVGQKTYWSPTGTDAWVMTEGRLNETFAQDALPKRACRWEAGGALLTAEEWDIWGNVLLHQDANLRYEVNYDYRVLPNGLLQAEREIAPTTDAVRFELQVQLDAAGYPLSIQVDEVTYPLTRVPLANGGLSISGRYAEAGDWTPVAWTFVRDEAGVLTQATQTHGSETYRYKYAYKQQVVEVTSYRNACLSQSQQMDVAAMRLLYRRTYKTNDAHGQHFHELFFDEQGRLLSDSRNYGMDHNSDGLIDEQPYLYRFAYEGDRMTCNARYERVEQSDVAFWRPVQGYDRSDPLCQYQYAKNAHGQHVVLVDRFRYHPAYPTLREWAQAQTFKDEVLTQETETHYYYAEWPLPSGLPQAPADRACYLTAEGGIFVLHNPALQTGSYRACDASGRLVASGVLEGLREVVQLQDTGRGVLVVQFADQRQQVIRF